MEFMKDDISSLFDKKDIKLSEEQFLTIAYNLICAVRYIHSANIIHRDLKPSNILLKSNCTLKICDFGLSRSMATDIKGY